MTMVLVSKDNQRLPKGNQIINVEDYQCLSSEILIKINCACAVSCCWTLLYCIKLLKRKE